MADTTQAPDTGGSGESLSSKVQQAIAAGVPIADIRERLLASPEFKQATDAGVTPDAIWQHLGLTTALSPTSFARTLGPTVGGALDQFNQFTGAMGSAATRGIVSTLALPGDLADLAAAKGPAATAPFFKDVGSVLPDEGTVNNILGNKVANLEVAPQGRTQQLLAAGVEGGASIVPALAFGGPLGLTAEGANALVGASTAGGLGGEIAHEVYPNSIIAPLVGSLATSLGTDTVFGAITGKLLSRGLNAAQGLESIKSNLQNDAKSVLDEINAEHEALQLAKKTTASDQGKEALTAFAQRDSDIAAAHDTANRAIEASNAAADAGKEAIATGIHPASTLQEAGTAVQGAATKWLAGMDDKVGALLNPLYEKVDPKTPVDLTNFKNALSEINNDAGALEVLNKDLKPSLPASWQSKLVAMENAAKLGIPGTAPTVGDLKVLRSSLGSALKDPKVVDDLGDQNARKLYATLTQDLRVPFANAGLGEAWDQANAQASSLYDYARDTVGKVIKSEGGKGNADPEKVASSLLTGGGKGGTQLTALRAELPDAADALAATAVRQGVWPKLSPEAKASLVPDSATRTNLDSTFTAAKAGEDTAKAQRDAAITAANQRVDALSAQHDQVISGINDSILENRTRALDAKAVLRAASADHDDAASALADVNKRLAANQAARAKSGVLRKMAYGAGGGAMLPEVARLLSGSSSPLVSGAGKLIGGGMLGISPDVAAVLGVGIPGALALGHAVVKNPSVLKLPAAALVGGHALAIAPTPQAQ